MIKQYRNILDKETDGVSNVGLQKISRMVISSRGKTIQHGSTYPMTVIVTRNVGRAILNTVSTNGLTSDGISTNSDKINLTNYVGGIRPCKNLKTMTLKNC